MTRVSDTVIQGENLSTAWLETVDLVLDGPNQKRFHTVTFVADPLAEVAEIRTACDALLASLGKPGVETVANTIFPSGLAALSKSAEDLVARYRTAYTRLRRFPGNHKGTYFGRIISYPAADGPRDQLGPLIRKLRQESTAPTGAMSARYEVSLVSALPDTDIAVPVCVPGSDNNTRGFPCLSLCSFQLINRRLHLIVHYRYEYLVQKGYGNYLGLARLLAYVATSAGLDIGQLTIVAGRICVDGGRRAIAQHLGSFLSSVSRM